MFLLAASIAPVPASADPAPRVRVVTSGTAETDASALYDWLVVRLLEEGYAVAGSGDAEIDLTIWPAERGWTVRAHGTTSEDFNVSTGDDVDVARLELLHRAVDALEAVEPRERPDDAADDAFAIDFATTFAAPEQAAVGSEIALAVLDGGGSLAPDRASAKFVICAAPDDGTTHVDVARSDEPCPVPPEGAVAQPPTREHTQELVEAVLLAQAGQPAEAEVVPEPASDSEKPPLDPAPYTYERRRVWPDSALVIRGGVSGGVIGRVRSPDGVVAGSMFIGREPGFSAWFDLQLWPAIPERGLSVFETVSAVGVRLRPVSGDQFSLDLGGLVGMQTHSYRFEGENNLQTGGVAFDWSLEGAAGFSVRFWREHEVQFLFRAGRSGRPRMHISPTGAILWHREAWRIGATVGIMFGRRLRR